jgi:SAM-dependent methyltransferase
MKLSRSRGAAFCAWMLWATLALCACRSQPAARLNRDLHGPADTAHYLEVLQDPARIAELRVEHVVNELALAPDAWVADLGCGPGIFALPFARACPQGLVFAADVEPGQLDALRARIATQGATNIVPVLASYSDPHLPLGRFALVFIGDTYHHLSDRKAYMRRLARCLAPGGRVAVLDYKPGDLPVGPPADHKLPPGQRARELESAGYELLESLDSHQWHDFEIWRLQPGA